MNTYLETLALIAGGMAAEARRAAIAAEAHAKECEARAVEAMAQRDAAKGDERDAAK